MVITSIITVKKEGKERGGEAVREDRGVVVAVHLDPRVAVVRRHNPEDENDHGGDCDGNLMIMLIIMVKMGEMVMP